MLLLESYAPALVFALLFIFCVGLGIMGGWKRSLFWGGGSIVYFFIAWGVSHFVSQIIGSSIAYDLCEFLFHEHDIFPSDVIGTLLTPLTNIALWVAITLFFNVVISIPIYFCIFKKKVKLEPIFKKSKQSVRFQIVNRVIGAVTLGTLTLPIVVNTTNTITGFSTDWKTINTSQDSFNKNINIMSRGVSYWDSPITAISSINSLVQIKDELSSYINMLSTLIDQSSGISPSSANLYGVVSDIKSEIEDFVSDKLSNIESSADTMRSDFQQAFSYEQISKCFNTLSTSLSFNLNQMDENKANHVLFAMLFGGSPTSSELRQVSVEELLDIKDTLSDSFFNDETEKDAFFVYYENLASKSELYTIKNSSSYKPLSFQKEGYSEELSIGKDTGSNPWIPFPIASISTVDWSALQMVSANLSAFVKEIQPKINPVSSEERGEWIAEQMSRFFFTDINKDNKPWSVYDIGLE